MTFEKYIKDVCPKLRDLSTYIPRYPAESQNVKYNIGSPRQLGPYLLLKANLEEWDGTAIISSKLRFFQPILMVSPKHERINSRWHIEAP